MVHINRQYPNIGVHISQETEFYRREQSPIYKTTTNKDGKWEIKDVDKDNYNIVAEKNKYGFKYLLNKNTESSISSINLDNVVYLSNNFSVNLQANHIYKESPVVNCNMILNYGDLTASSNLNRILEKVEPDEIYNLAAQSHVRVSFEVPEYTAEVDAVGTLRFLDAIKETGVKSKFYQASTSELYGKVQEIPQSEKTPFYPRSPYAAAKLYAFWITVNYREAYKLFACNGILFNHESPRRGETFVTRKITRAAARIKYGIQKILFLGNLNAKRDWDMRPSMWRACGKFCNRMSRAIMFLPQGKHTP